MALTSDTNRRLEDAQSQIVRLREQVEALMKNRVTPAVSDFADQAGKAVSGATDTMRDQSQVVSGRVKQRPLLAIAIAAAVGWVVGRVMR